MGYGTSGLTFNALRGANAARLPQFKNKHGQLAHSQADGSDWTPAQWLQAMVGELGEYAAARHAFERGEISPEVYRSQAEKEQADVATYGDILARRSLDAVEGMPGLLDAAQLLQFAIADLGTYANARKKLDRGDLSATEFYQQRQVHLGRAVATLQQLLDSSVHSIYGDAEVVERHPLGVDLGRAVIDKFNEVSERVGSSVRLAADDWHYVSAQDVAP